MADPQGITGPAAMNRLSTLNAHDYIDQAAALCRVLAAAGYANDPVQRETAAEALWGIETLLDHAHTAIRAEKTATA